MSNRKRLIVGLIALFSGLMLTGCGPSHAELSKTIWDGNLKEMESILAKKPGLINVRMKEISPLAAEKKIGQIFPGDMKWGLSALHIAAASGHVEIVKSLIQHGAEVNTKDKAGFTPLHWAAMQGHNEVAELLIAKGAEVNTKSIIGRTPLYSVMLWLTDLSASLTMAELLIANGADINAKDDDGSTPLHMAATIGLKKVVKLLINNGADVNAKTKTQEVMPVVSLTTGTIVGASNGSTPLHLAAMMGHKEIVELLIANGADVNAKNESAIRTIVVEESQGGKKIGESTFTWKKVGGYTPLYWAAVNNYKDIAELLLTKGADVNAKDEDGDTPLDIAVREGHKDIAELLRKAGAAEESAEPATEIAEVEEIAKPATETAEAKVKVEVPEADEAMPWWSPPGLFSQEGSEERMARMQERWENMSEQERQTFRTGMRERQERWEGMSEEERQEYLAIIRERRERWRNMSEEERQEFRARMREERQE